MTMTLTSHSATSGANAANAASAASSASTPGATPRLADAPTTSTRGTGREGLPPPVDARLRQAFERALARREGGGPEEESAPGAGNPADTSAVPAAPAVVPSAGAAASAASRAAAEPARLHREPEAPVFLTSQPVGTTAPALPAAEFAASSRGAPHLPPALGAALSALTMPASPEGPQHWQFSFSQAGSAVAGVTLSAQPQAPWLVQVNLHAQALAGTPLRERSALDARLGELRQRLLGRGAHIDAVELHEPHDPPRQR